MSIRMPLPIPEAALGSDDAESAGAGRNDTRDTEIAATHGIGFGSDPKRVLSQVPTTTQSGTEVHGLPFRAARVGFLSLPAAASSALRGSIRRRAVRPPAQLVCGDDALFPARGIPPHG